MKKINVYKNFFMSKKFLAVMALVLLFSIDAFAQAEGKAGIEAAATQLKSYYTPVKNLCLALAAVIGIIGGVRIYIKWNSGDQDIQKELLGWGGACLFLILVPFMISSFFGIK